MATVQKDKEAANPDSSGRRPGRRRQREPDEHGVGGVEIWRGFSIYGRPVDGKLSK